MEAMSDPVERSLRASVKEGVAAQAMMGIMDFYTVPFALFIGATTSQIGLLVAVPHLLASLSQLFVVDAVRWASRRRRLLIIGSALQTLTLAPLPWVTSVPVLMALLTAYRITGAMLGPAWGSLMSDYLPEHRRGTYFGMRAQMTGLCGMLTLCLCGVLLGKVGFPAVLAAAAAARAISVWYMAQMADMPEHPHPPERFPVRDFVARLRQSNFARFALYVGGITFATQLTSAYFSVHMVRDLGLSYAAYTAVHLAASLTGFLSFPIWGRHADLVGNARVLRLNSVLIPLIPVLWLVSKNPAWLFCVEAFSGFVWAGFNLCAANYLFDAVPAQRRVRALGYFNLLSGVCVFLGAGAGGWLADRLPAFLGWKLNTLFLLSAVLRAAADLFLSRSFTEVRASVRKTEASELFFSVVGLRPLAGENVEPAIRASSRTSS